VGGPVRGVRVLVGCREEPHAWEPAVVSSAASRWSPLPPTPSPCHSRGGHFRAPRVSVGSVSTHSPERVAAGRKSTFQIFGKEVCLIDYSMYPVPSAVREPICCECQARFGGCLPMPRVKAALPYWVPLSLRPRKQCPPPCQAQLKPSTPEHRLDPPLPEPSTPTSC
uniref:VWFC domain-containing protein n=1 Tax=Felis catus TaxID=9685 RepID=A0ABI7WHE6_FELCA